ncbi:hypothetical protein HYV85_00635 [Candidatus Woesearchaeota archaeon]|nr:hypothetical protein [Candidatus Woesearchaeota archaeon]
MSAQLGGIGNTGNLSNGEVTKEQPTGQGYGYLSQGDVEPELFCKSGEVNCWKFGFWCVKKWECDSAIWCGFGYKHCDTSSGKIYCYNNKPVCCSSSAKLCSGGCWTDDCPSGTTWTCGSSGAYCATPCTDKDGDGYGSGCSKGFDCNDNDASVNKNNVCGVCAKEPANYGKMCTACNGDCCATSNYICNYAGTGAMCPVTPKAPQTEKCNNADDDCDGKVDEDYSLKGTSCTVGSGNCKATSTYVCNSAQTGVECPVTPKQPSTEVCNGVDDNCNGQVDEGVCCVDNDGDGYGSGCSKGSDCNDNNANINPGKSEMCGDNKDNDCDGLTDEGCCPSSKPYSWGGQCNECPQDKQKKCGSTCYSGSESYSNCLDTKYPNWNCRPNGKSVCCPSGAPYWWESDSQCHKGSEPQKCSVPDGSSANCDCDSDSDCPSSSGKPYCGEGGSLYDVRTPQGFHACLTTKPEYCGNGKCAGNENYNNCAADCGSLAPKGTITTEVVYYGGSQKDKPIQGAYIYLDGISKGNTGSDGKLSFETSYGQKTVKVECPDSTFCDSITVHLSTSSEYKRVRCICNPPGDSDNDGYSDNDERLLGTDPKSANSNFGTTFASDSVDLLACIPTPASFFILWKEYKKSGSIIQSHSLVVNSLNVTSVMSASFGEEPYIVAQALASAGFETEGAEVIVNPVNVTLENVMKKAEYVDGVRMQDGILLIATDKDGQTTALIAIGAGCVGAFGGVGYGIGQGLFDDVRFVIDSIWFIVTHLDEIKKIWSAARDLVTGVVELLKSPGETVWTLFRNTLDKGERINLFTDDRVNNPDPYRHFQVGFFYGFVTGYVVEQVVLGKIIFSFLAKTFKVGQLLGKTGKAVKLMEKLEIVKGAEEFGAEIAEKLSKLKYLKEGIENWLDSEIQGLARIMKHNEDWLKGLSEAEAKVAAKHADELTAAGKITDAAFGDLTKTKLGQQTLKASDATTDLLAKQSKLVQKWGAKKADEVVTKCFLVWCDAERVVNLKKITNVIPENLVKDFEPDKAVKFLGDKKFVEAAEKVASQLDAATINKVANTVDDFEDLVGGADIVLKKFNSLDEFKAALSVCNSPCKIPNVEEVSNILKNIRRFFGKKVSHFGDTFSSKFKNAQELESAVKAGDHGNDVRRVFEETIKSPLSQRQSATSFANAQNTLGAKLVKTEKEVNDFILAKKLPKPLSPGADYVAEIAKTRMGISVETMTKTPAGVTIRIYKSSNELKIAKELTGMWDESVLHLQVKASDYDAIVKLVDDFYKDASKVKNVEDFEHFRVIITKVEDFVVN